MCVHFFVLRFDKFRFYVDVAICFVKSWAMLRMHEVTDCVRAFVFMIRLCIVFDFPIFFPLFVRFDQYLYWDLVVSCVINVIDWCTFEHRSLNTIRNENEYFSHLLEFSTNRISTVCILMTLKFGVKSYHEQTIRWTEYNSNWTNRWNALEWNMTQIKCQSINVELSVWLHPQNKLVFLHFYL